MSSPRGVLLAFDPASITGFSVWRGGVEETTQLVDYGEFSWGPGCLDCFADLEIDCLIIEDGYEPRPSQGRAFQGSKHNKRIGFIVGWFRKQCGLSLDVWVPLPSAWRKEVRDAGYEMAYAPRALCKENAFTIAEGLGAHCLGPKGGKKYDRADAICIGIAGMHRRARRGRVAD